VSLREQFAPDLVNVFHNTDEFATTREFRVSNGHGGFNVFAADVVWDEEAAKKQPVVAIHGVYMGDVICHIKHLDLPRAPVAGELIYSPANKPWEVLQVTDEESEWVLALSATRSQPAFYGGN
jgi:hypothetical protein